MSTTGVRHGSRRPQPSGPDARSHVIRVCQRQLFAQGAAKAAQLEYSVDVTAHLLLSFVYVQKRQYDQALAEGEQAIALDPNNADSYSMQAEVLNLVGRPEEALRLVEQAMRLNPHYPPVYSLRLGWAYFWIGRYDEAVATLKATISRNPNLLVAQILLAGSYVQQWASQESPDTQTLALALATVQRGLTISESFPLSHVILGFVHPWQKQYEQAIAAMERAIALDSTFAGGYAGLAEVLSRVGRSEEGIATIEQALHRKPIVPDSHLNSVGAAYYLAGRPEEAIAPLKQYLARYPNRLEAHLTLAAVYSKLSKEAEARAEAAEVLRLNPKFSLEVHKERVPIKDPTTLQRFSFERGDIPFRRPG